MGYCDVKVQHRGVLYGTGTVQYGKVLCSRVQQRGVSSSICQVSCRMVAFRFGLVRFGEVTQQFSLVS